MKRFVFLPLLASLLATTPARAVAIFAGGKPVLVQEDYVFLYQEPGSKQVHVLYSARVAPAFRRVQLGYPTPSGPKIETVVIDLPEALHKLVAPHEMRLDKLPPAPPASWETRGARFDSYTENKGSADHVFDAAWTNSYVDKGFFIAGLGVVTDEDGRVEVMTPSVHISFESERMQLARREPPLLMPIDESGGSDIPDKPNLPVEVKVVKTEPQLVDLAPESAAKRLQNRSRPLLDCYEVYLEKKPNSSITLEFSTTIRPQGDVIESKGLGTFDDEPTKRLSACMAKVLEKQRIPNLQEGYKFKWRIALTPPRTPARRTHIFAIGSSKYVWPNLPASVRLEHDFEILPQDAILAIPDSVRKAMQWADNQRVWISHWIDKSARRTEAEDVVFEHQELPARGESGALPLEKTVFQPKQDEKVTARKTNTKRPSRETGLITVLVAGLIVALGLAYRESREA